VTIVAVGPQLKTAMDSLVMLKKAGIDAEVIYAHTIKPFDYESVRESVKKTKKYLVIEEHSQFGGAGDEVMRAALGIDHVRAAFISIPNQFSRWYGQYLEHCAGLGMTPENITNEAVKLCKA